MQRQDTSRHLVPARDDLSRAEGEVNVTLIEDLAAWQHALVGHHHSLAVLLADARTKTVTSRRRGRISTHTHAVLGALANGKTRPGRAPARRRRR